MPSRGLAKTEGERSLKSAEELLARGKFVDARRMVQKVTHRHAAITPARKIPLCPAAICMIRLLSYPTDTAKAQLVSLGNRHLAVHSLPVHSARQTLSDL